MSDEFEVWLLEEKKNARDIAIQRRSRRDTKQRSGSRHYKKHPCTRYGAFRAAARGARYSQDGSSAYPVILRQKSGCRCCRERIKGSENISMPHESSRSLGNPRMSYVIDDASPVECQSFKSSFASIGPSRCHPMLCEADHEAVDSIEYIMVGHDEPVDSITLEDALESESNSRGYAATLANIFGFGWSGGTRATASDIPEPEKFDYVADEDEEEDWVMLIA